MAGPAWAWTLEVLYGVLAIVAAAVILRAGASRPVNQWFGALLIVEGIGWGGIASGLLTPYEGRWTDLLYDVFAVSTVMLPLLSLGFILWAVDTPLTTPLRTRGARRVLLASAVAAALGYVFTGRTSDAAYEAWVDGAGWALVIVSLFGLAVALRGYQRTTPGTLQSRRAGAYLIAFAARDLGMVFTNVTLIYAFERVGGTPAYAGLRDWVLLAAMSYFFVFLAALAYGVLRMQVLELDRRLRITISRGTVVAVFVAVILGVVEAMQNWFSDRLGWAAGGIAAAVLVMAIHPVQRFADNVAKGAVRRSDAIVDLAPSERLALYREQVALAWQDGTFTSKERAILRNLRERLSISIEDAGRVELEVSGG